MQFAVFRNYSSGPQAVLQYSAWKSNPEDLREFLKNTTASGGQGNEAIEIGLWHANQQADVRRVILIGDAAGNSDKETADKRAGFGNTRWNKTSYETPTTVSAEVRKLAEKKIPIDCFYVLDRCKQAFESYAQATEGKAFLLDMSPAARGPGQGRELLIGENPSKKVCFPSMGHVRVALTVLRTTGHITTSILQYVGGNQGDDLVAAYTKKFGKMHS